MLDHRDNVVVEVSRILRCPESTDNGKTKRRFLFAVSICPIGRPGVDYPRIGPYPRPLENALLWPYVGLLDMVIDDAPHVHQPI
jgi:hypothetical protein